MKEPTTIYIALLNEGTDAWRPVEALHLEGDIYQITSTNDVPDEEWEFESGDIVRCKSRVFSDGAEANIAYKLVREN